MHALQMKHPSTAAWSRRSSCWKCASTMLSGMHQRLSSSALPGTNLPRLPQAGELLKSRFDQSIPPVSRALALPGRGSGRGWPTIGCRGPLLRRLLQPLKVGSGHVDNGVLWPSSIPTVFSAHSFCPPRERSHANKLALSSCEMSQLPILPSHSARTEMPVREELTRRAGSIFSFFLAAPLYLPAVRSPTPQIRRRLP